MAIADDIKAYVAALGAEPLQELQNLSQGVSVTIIGEDHSALFRSLEILDGLIANGRYRYFANEWFLNAGAIRRGLRAVWRGGDLPPNQNGGAAGREERALTLRYGPWVAALHRIRQQRLYHLAIGSRAEGAARDQRIAVHYVDETVDRGLARTSRGVALLGAAHASEVAFKGHRTTRQILESYGWEFLSVRIFEGGPRHSEGFPPNPERGFVEPLAGGNSFSLPGLLPNGVHQLAVQTRRRHQGKRSPFHFVGETASTNGRSVAQQFEVVVLARDP